YAANAMLATRISFMNELANLCDVVGADIEHVRKGLGADARIGTKFLYAGVAVNERQKHRMAEDIHRHFEGKLAGKRIAVWGLAFKPGTDDIREAPALTLAEDLLAAGAEVV